MCNCGIEAENSYLLESLVACHDVNSKLVMYFMVNTTFVNYLEEIDNLTDSMRFPILTNKTTFEQTLPLYLKAFKLDSDLLTTPKTLKDFNHQFKQKKEIFDVKGRHDTRNVSNKNFFSNNFIIVIFLFIASIISLLVTTLAIHLLHKHKKLRILVASLALQQVKEVGTGKTQQDNTACKCMIHFYIILALSIPIFGLLIFVILHSTKLKLCRGHLFSNAVKVMLFISDVQYYIPIKLCKTAGSIYLFKITGTLTPDKVKLKWNLIWIY